MKDTLRSLLLLGLLVSALAATTVLNAQEDGAVTASPHSRITLGGRFSEDVQEYYLDGIVPFYSTDRTAYMFDLRGTLLEDLEQEINAGLVARRLSFDGRVILGANLFYDVRWTENDNQFNQVGAGLEALSTWVDARFNYYQPTDDAKVLSDSVETDVSRVGSTRISETSRLRTYEEALKGYDAEIGVWLPYLARRMPTGIFVGYYDFESDVTDNLSGAKVRLESRIHRHVTIDAEWFEDDTLNRTDYFVGVRFTMSCGDKGSARTAVRPLVSRMNDIVHRDLRIRTISTGPVVVDSTREETSIRRRPSEELPPPPEPNCYLDDGGNVVCE